MTNREKLIALLNHVGQNVMQFKTGNFIESLADYLIENGVNFAPAVVNLRIEIDHNDFSEEVAETAKERGWYRKRFFCPCGQLINVESWEKEHCFGSASVLRMNNIPNNCPNCGARIDK